MTNAPLAIKGLDSTAIKHVKMVGQIRGFSAGCASMEEELVILGNLGMDLTTMECYADVELTTQETIVKCGEQLPTRNAKPDIVLLDVVFADLQLQIVIKRVTMEESIYLAPRKLLSALLTREGAKLMIKKMVFSAIQSA